MEAYESAIFRLEMRVMNEKTFLWKQGQKNESRHGISGAGKCREVLAAK